MGCEYSDKRTVTANFIYSHVLCCRKKKSGQQKRQAKGDSFIFIFYTAHIWKYIEFAGDTRSLASKTFVVRTAQNEKKNHKNLTDCVVL